MNQPVKPSPLGRGLSALFGDADASYAAPKPQAAAPVATVTPITEATKVVATNPTHLAITWLQPGAFQPRRHFDDEALKELAVSIKQCGILEPLVVRPVMLNGVEQKEQFEIIAGERRWRASQICGLHEVPVIVRHLTDKQALEFGIIENVQREDLSPLEEAEAYKRLLEEFKHTQEGLSLIIGKSRPHIGNMLRILTLPPAVKQMIERGELTLGHARTLVTAKDPLALAELIIKKGLSVRQAEALAKHAQEVADPKKIKAKADVDFAIDVLEKDLAREIGMKVKITQNGKGGSFTVYYKDLDQCDLIMKRLCGR